MSTTQQMFPPGAEQELEQVLSGSDVHSRVAAELFSFAEILGEQGSLLRSLTDPGRKSSDRAKLIDDVTASVYVPQTTRILGWLAGKHWSRPQYLREAVEELGVLVILLDARSRHQLGQVGTELFEILRMVSDERDLRIQLSDLSVGDQDSRQALIKGLLAGRVLPATEELTAHAVKTAEHGHLLRLLRQYGREAAGLIGAQLVSVQVATPLTDAQRDRLHGLIEQQAGGPVVMAVAVEPDLMGGFRVNYGDEAADSSIRTEINVAKRQLVR